MSSRTAALHADGSAWSEIARASARRALTDFATVTVVSTIPGWGRTVWMRQCQDHLEREDGARTVWLGSRRALEDYCEAIPDDVDVVFIDDALVTASDPLWECVTRLVESPGRPRVVASSLDCPPPLAGAEVQALTERDLAFTPDEVDRLATANGVSAPPGLYAAVATRYRGSPTLARRHLERLQASGASARWASPDARLDIHLATELTARVLNASSGTPRESALVRLVMRAARFRRVSVDLLTAPGEDLSEISPHFARLAALPFGSIEVDAETGQTVFEWSEHVWSLIEQERSPEGLTHRLQEALTTTRERGHVAMQAYYLVRLGDLRGADALVYEHFRYFLLACHDVTVRAIQDLPWNALKACPSLLLLLGELRVRATGSAAESAMYHSAAAQALAAKHADTPFERLRLTARRMFAAVSLGERGETRRLLDEISTLLEGPHGGGLLASAGHDPYVADRLAAEMYLPFWAATQLDDHERGMAFARVMRTHANPRSRTAIAEQLTALTEEVFAGVHDPEDPDLAATTTSPMALLEEGDDDGALERIRMLAERSDASPSRSAAEGFVLSLQALVAPQMLTAHSTTQALERSRRFWSDGQASSVVLGSTAFAHLSRGDAGSAARLLRSAPVHDWFIVMVDALVMLATDRAADALPRLSLAARLCHAPRARAVTGVLAASAHQQLGQRESAVEQLESVWHEFTPGLTRFALRLLTAQDFAELASDGSDWNPELAALIEAARGDARHLTRVATVEFTRADRENLALLREGMTNVQIAKERFVSVNTVRTQLRLLMRKLGATDRTDAVARAARLGAFDED